MSTQRDIAPHRPGGIWQRSSFAAAVACVLSFQVAAAAPPRAPTLALQSYFQARAVLDEAVQASGGLQALQDLRSVRRELLDDWVDVGQGQHPWRGTPSAERLVAHDGFKDSEVLAFTDYAGRRFFQSEKYADSPVEYAVEINAAGADSGFQSITYVAERPYRRDYSIAELTQQRTTQLRRYPEGLLRLALERPETLAWLGRTREDGAEQDVITVTDTTGAHLVLYFDAHTHLLTKAETLRAHPVAGDTRTETQYSDYRRVGALELPYRIVDRVAGVPTHYWRVRVIELDASFPEERFQAPQDGVAMEESPAEPTLQPLGDGLYLIRGSYNVMFAVFADYVLVVETPAGASYVQKCLEFIRATAPGKPIRYAVASHFHFDHIAGVRTYVAEGIPILTTSDAKEVIEQSLASVRTMHPDALSRKSAKAVIEVASGPRVFEDAGQRAEIYDFGLTPHVGQLLVTYFPKAKLLFVADLFDVLTTELVIAGVDGVAMAKKIDELGLDVERIIPVHGVPLTMDDLRRGLVIRAKYVH